VSCCGVVYGSLSDEFAALVELELVYADVQARLACPPSREVFREEHRRHSERLGRRAAYRETLMSLVRASAAD